MRRTNCQRVIFHSPSPPSPSPSANTSICKTLMCKSLHMNNSNPHSPHVTPRIVMYVNVRLCQENMNAFRGLSWKQRRVRVNLFLLCTLRCSHFAEYVLPLHSILYCFLFYPKVSKSRKAESFVKTFFFCTDFIRILLVSMPQWSTDSQDAPAHGHWPRG